jgi:hypothetical protein
MDSRNRGQRIAARPLKPGTKILGGAFTYEQEQKFGSRLWAAMVDRFVVLYREFSVQYQEDVRYVIEKIHDLAGDELQQASGIVPLRTFYNYQKVFVALGYTDVAPRHIVPQGENSFSEYFFWVDEVNSKLGFRELFRSKF